MYTQNISQDFHKFLFGRQSADVAGFRWIAVFVLLDPGIEKGARSDCTAGAEYMEPRIWSPCQTAALRDFFISFKNGDQPCAEVQTLPGLFLFSPSCHSSVEVEHEVYRCWTYVPYSLNVDVRAAIPAMACVCYTFPG